MYDERQVQTPESAGAPSTAGLALEDWILPGCIALAWAAVALSPRSMGPLVALLASVLTAGAAGALALLDARPVHRPTLLLVALAGIPLPWLAVCTTLAPEPRISLWGLFGQHGGLLASVAAWSVFAAYALYGGPRDCRRVLRVVASAGALASLSTVADRLGLLAYAERYATAPSGVFENSITLAEGLLVAIGCAGAWALLARDPRERAAAIGSLGIVGLGIALASSRGAFVGLAVGVAAGTILVRGAARGRLDRVLGIAITILGTLVTIGVIASLALSERVPAVLRAVSTNRIDLWRAAGRTAMIHPLFGKGPEQFSAFWRWDVSTSGTLSASGAYDVHDAVLGLAASGGFVGLALGIVAVSAVGLALAGAVRASRSSRAVICAVAGLAAWSVSLLFAWVGVLPSLTAAAVAGSLVGAARPASADPAPRRATWRVGVAVVAASLALVVAALGLRPLRAESLWVRAASGTGRLAAASEAFFIWPDPTYSVAVMEGLVRRAVAEPALAASSLAQARSLADGAGDAARWHVATALMIADVAQALDMLTGRPSWALFERAVRAGKEADPATGLWDYAAAIEAARTGRPDLARSYARAALEFPLPEQPRQRMRTLARADKPPSGE